MANREMKHPMNVDGMYYCTSPDDPGGEGCTACAICYDAAPEFYASDEDGFAYVMRQPATDEDITFCREQMDACPSVSIGDDGE